MQPGSAILAEIRRCWPISRARSGTDLRRLPHPPDHRCPDERFATLPKPSGTPAIRAGRSGGSSVGPARKKASRAWSPPPEQLTGWARVPGRGLAVLILLAGSREKSQDKVKKPQTSTWPLSRPGWTNGVLITTWGNYYFQTGGRLKLALAAQPHCSQIQLGGHGHGQCRHGIRQDGWRGPSGEVLVKAIRLAPDKCCGYFNLGLLRPNRSGQGAEKELREAFRLDPKMAPAAYNLLHLEREDAPRKPVLVQKSSGAEPPRSLSTPIPWPSTRRTRGTLRMLRRPYRIFLTRRPGFTDGYLLLRIT